MAETRMNAYYGVEKYNIQYFFYGLIAAFLRGSIVQIIQLCELLKLWCHLVFSHKRLARSPRRGNLFRLQNQDLNISRHRVRK